MMLYSKDSLESQFLAWRNRVNNDEMQLHALKNNLPETAQSSILIAKFEHIKEEIYDAISSASEAFQSYLEHQNVQAFDVVYKLILEHIEALMSVTKELCASMLAQYKVVSNKK